MLQTTMVNLDPQKVAEGHRLRWRWTGPTTMTERFDQNLYPTFNTALTIMNMQDAAAAFTDIMTGYSEQLETWLQYLRFVRGNYIDVSVAHYQPLQGAAFVQLPKYVQNKKSTINVQNKDNMCFKWAVLSALHRAPHHAERVTWYKPYENDLNFTGIAFPVLKDAIAYKKFEQKNPTISLSVYCFIEEEQMDGKKVKGEITVDNFHRKLMIFYYVVPFQPATCTPCAVALLWRALCLDQGLAGIHKLRRQASSLLPSLSPLLQDDRQPGSAYERLQLV